MCECALILTYVRTAVGKYSTASMKGTGCTPKSSAKSATPTQTSGTQPSLRDRRELRGTHAHVSFHQV